MRRGGIALDGWIDSPMAGGEASLSVERGRASAVGLGLQLSLRSASCRLVCSLPGGSIRHHS
eukprot:14206920-Alexandrium_andersonii.AAC.1